jgi:hypothetical protein
MAVAPFLFTRSHHQRALPIDRAMELVVKDSNFDTGREAGDTLVRAATELLAEARTCVTRHGETPYCLTFRSAAAWSNVAGVKALTCRAPGRFALQHTALDFYADLESLPQNVRDIPRVPPLPECG